MNIKHILRKDGENDIKLRARIKKEQKMKYRIEIEKIKRTTGVYEFEVDSKEDMYKILDDKHPSIFGKCIEKHINEIKEYPIREVK